MPGMSCNCHWPLPVTSAKSLSMSEIFEVRHEKAFETMRGHAPCTAWPYAGAKLDTTLRERFGLPDDAAPRRIILKGTRQDYGVTPNGYLIPYYAPSRDVMDRSRLDERNEELIIDRARAFINNAQPELGVLRSRAQIEADIITFDQMPEGTHTQLAEKAAQFKIITGAIITRLEMLGRMIYQRNTEGVKTEYQQLTGRMSYEERMESSTPDTTEREVRTLSDKEVEQLRAEAIGYYKFMIHPAYTPYLRTILLTDKKIDRDGILIDLVREIGKGLRIANERNEDFVRGGITQKIGWSIESIDKVHAELTRAITTEPTAALFEHSIQNFLRERGGDYDLHSVRDVLDRLDEFANLCRGRACIRSDDAAYSEVFRRKSVLTGLFNGENGLLQSMRRVGRNTGSEISELRSLLTRGVKLMERTAYTRMPCDEHAPDIWVPQLCSDDPMEEFLTRQFITSDERTRSKRVMGASEMLPGAERRSFLNREFCSLGRLSSDLNMLQKSIHDKGHEVAPMER